MVKKFRAMAKPLIIFICITFIGGALYIGGMSFFGGKNDAYAAVATVNGEPITLYDLLNALNQELYYYQMYYGELDFSTLETIRYYVYDNLVNNSLITQALAQRKYKIAEDDIKAEMTRFKELYGQELLDQSGVTDAQIREYVTVQLQFDKLVEDVTSQVVVSEQEIIDYYEAVRASHILVRVDSDDQEAWDQAKAEAEKILAQLDTMDFAEAAMTYSDDSSAVNGGDLGFIYRGQTVEPFEQAAFSLAVGEVSDLVKTQYGYHIIKVTDKKVAEGEEFESAKESIREQLLKQKQNQVFNTWLAEQRSQAEVVILDKQLAAYEYLVNGNYDKAIETYQKAIDEDPENGYLYALLGQVYAQQEQLEPALTAYEQAVKYIQNDAQIYFILGSLYQELGQQQEAISAYLRVSELRSYDLVTQYLVRSRLTELNAGEDAIAVVDKRIADISKLYEDAAQSSTSDAATAEMDSQGETE